MARKQNPYSSVAQFAMHHGIILPRPFDWRLIQNPSTGEIHGISGIRGFAIATNGILVAIENDAKDVAFGHLDYFNEDQDTVPSGTSKAPKRKVKIQEYL